MSVRRRASGRAHYNYFRDYDPESGRYIESDPLGLNAGINTFSYAGSDPLSYLDSFGLEVRMTFNRRTGILATVEVGTGKTVIVKAFSGLGKCKNNRFCEADKNVGPIQSGYFLIGDGYHRGTSGDDWWYKLYGPDGNGGYSNQRMPVKDPITGYVHIRNGMNLHTGSSSKGCLTVYSDILNGQPGYPASAAYDRLKALLDGTAPITYNGTTFRGILHVQ